MEEEEYETNNIDEEEEVYTAPPKVVKPTKSGLTGLIHKIKTHDKFPIFASFAKILIIIVLVAVIASNVVLWYHYYESKNLQQPSELEITAEFQIDLKTKHWDNRDKQLLNFFSFFQEISGYPFLDQPLIENYRAQTFLHADACGLPFDVDFRLRNYYYGPSTNTSTLDAKIATISYDEGLVAPLEPSDEQLEHSFQKLEHDIHPCTDKYSRETRVQDIPYDPNYTTCGDLHNLFPYLWSEKANNKLLNQSDPEYWYTGVYTGIFDNGLKFKSDITLQYHKQKDVANTKLEPKSGEYSLRVWSTHLGHGPWDEDALAQVADWYHQLLAEFDNDGCNPYDD